MKFNMEGAEIFVPDAKPATEALLRTTHMGISAHHDDIEIMAYQGISECFGSAGKWFTGVVVTNGSGSPRNGLYADYTDDDMRQIRKLEQKKAAFVGEYGAQVLLDYSSAAVKDPGNPDVVEDLKNLLQAARPEVVYIHNLADKHDTHVATALRVIQALRELPQDQQPDTVYGCEIWRDLDWMMDEDKVVMDVHSHENIAMSLVGVFDSQICGGKRYDLATEGRRRANATYHASHAVDEGSMLWFAMDLTPLIKDLSLNVNEYVIKYIRRFEDEIDCRLKRLTQAAG